MAFQVLMLENQANALHWNAKLPTYQSACCLTNCIHVKGCLVCMHVRVYTCQSKCHIIVGNLMPRLISQSHILAIFVYTAKLKYPPNVSVLQYLFTSGTHREGPNVIKLFSCSTQLSTKFQLLIRTKIPTNKKVSCFKSLRCFIYHANQC